jgi:hypothetical protein
MGLKRIIAKLLSRVPTDREPSALWVALCLLPDAGKLLMLGVFSTRGKADHFHEQFADVATEVALAMGMKKGDRYDLQFFDWHNAEHAMIAVRTWLVNYAIPSDHAVEFARSINTDIIKGDY